MRTASPTFSIQTHPVGFSAVATFKAGFGSARRPVFGPVAATAGDALAALLASPDLARVLTSMIDPPAAPDAD